MQHTTPTGPLYAIFLMLLCCGTLSAQSDTDAWRTYFGVTYNTANSDVVDRGIGPGYGLVGVANVAFGAGNIKPVISLGGAGSYGGDDESGESGFLMVRPFVGAGAEYAAVESDDFKLVPRLLVGADAIGLYIDDTDNGEGSINAFVNPGVAIRANGLSLSLDYRFSVANLSTIIDDDSDYPADLGEPTDLAPGTLTLTAGYRAVLVHASIWSRDAEFDDAIATVSDAELWDVNGLTLGLCIALGK